MKISKFSWGTMPPDSPRLGVNAPRNFVVTPLEVTLYNGYPNGISDAVTDGAYTKHPCLGLTVIALSYTSISLLVNISALNWHSVELLIATLGCFSLN